jgi:hypothetical protein
MNGVEALDFPKLQNLGEVEKEAELVRFNGSLTGPDHHLRSTGSVQWDGINGPSASAGLVEKATIAPGAAESTLAETSCTCSGVYSWN